MRRGWLKSNWKAFLRAQRATRPMSLGEALDAAQADDPDTRYQAMQQLARIGGPEASRAVAAALEDPVVVV